ncbi:VOC family protein [Muriicola sp. E247]|uniref:VOC family protein n=1 Tax=Muriicola sp. E247 TaxID=3242730 RepID=UPI003524C453
MTNSAFHLALPCYSVTKTRKFYIEILGAELGRHSTQWADINLYGNQITFTKSGEFSFNYKSYKFGDNILPSFHFGVILNEKKWNEIHQKISEILEKDSEPITFLKSKKGEHTSFFIEDPNGYVVEFKCFKEPKEVFAS